MISTEQLYSIFLDHPQACTDTRTLIPGSVFFALKGENFNANRFAEQALAGGCAYAVIDEKEYLKDERFLLVPDVLQALQDLARHHRRTLNIPVVGITGSNGKTTTKELISCVLARKYKTYATKGNLNNHIGVPLTLLSITREHEIAVVEMGANHVGEIEMLCTIVQPTHGIITNIGKAHLEGFGGPQGVIKAKNELYQHVRQANGTLFVNIDNPLLADLSKDVTRYCYGTKNANIMGEFVSADPFVKLRWKPSSDQRSLNEKETVETQLIGKYNFENILAAACIGYYFDVDGHEINIALERYVPSNNRSQVLKKGSNTILLDAYNANPTSMAAALENFYEMQSGNKLLILGDMLELGEDTEKEHQHIVDLLNKKNLSNALLVGSHFLKVNNTVGAKQFSNSEEALQWLKDQRIENSTVLIKGSRGIRLEKLVEAF